MILIIPNEKFYHPFIKFFYVRKIIGIPFGKYSWRVLLNLLIYAFCYAFLEYIYKNEKFFTFKKIINFLTVVLIHIIVKLIIFNFIDPISFSPFKNILFSFHGY